MLFHVTHTHSYQTCPAHNPEIKSQIANALQTASEKGVELKMVTVDGPGHVFFMLLEADSYEAIMNFFEPLLEIGDADIRPVMDFAAVLDLSKDWDE